MYITTISKVRQMMMAAMGVVPALVAAQSERPNIIYIMCDDMGYGDLGCYGQQLISTPNIDQMAREGMRFTQAYAGSPVSAPSRACFMTGQHSGHGYVRGNREYWNRGGIDNSMFNGRGDYWIVGQEPYLMTHEIIPELFKKAGYNTGMFGKWAGGYWNSRFPDSYALDGNGNTDTDKYATTSSMSLPNKRGVDCFYGPVCQFQAHTYYPNFLNRYDPDGKGDKYVVAETMEQNIQHATIFSGNTDFENRKEYSADKIHEYAMSWIDRMADKNVPFLGIFTYTLPHAELWQPNDSILQKYNQAFRCDEKSHGWETGNWYYKNTNSHAQFAAMITRLDAYVGEIRAKLKERGLDRNTLVIFTSDNGPHEEGGADPTWFNRDGLLRGTKRSTHEGGIRIPYIACGPNVPVGVVNDHQLAFYDVMPTLLDYIGEKEAARAHSLEASTEGDRFDGISFYNTLTGNNEAQQKHEFLYWEFHETDMMGLRMGDWKMVVSGGNCRLYDLANDIHEDTDVAAQYPEVVAKMKQIIKEQHVNSDLFSVTLPK